MSHANKRIHFAARVLIPASIKGDACPLWTPYVNGSTLRAAWSTKNMLRKLCRAAIRVALIAAGLVPSVSDSVFAQQVTIDGSTGMFPIATELVQAFKFKNAAAPIVLGRGSPSMSAMRDVADGKIVIGLSSDPLGETERAAGLQSIEVARTAVVFGVNSAVTIAGLTSEQVCGIYAGKIKNWKDVGGPALSIVPLTRPTNSFEPTMIRTHISCFKESREIISVPKAGDMAKALATNGGAIGMTNATFVAESHGAIRALAWNGTAPTRENIQAGSYPMVRRFYFVVKGAPSGTVSQFVAFVKGVEGQKIITETKAVPVK